MPDNNLNQILEKVIISVGVGEGAADKKVIEAVSQDLMVITGQKPKITRARKAVSGFKLRKGDPIGLMVTLRGKRMIIFLKKLFAVVLPRIRDFQGVSAKGFDGRGNYNLGIAEQIVFPEIDYDKVDRIRGLQITIVTKLKSDQEAKEVLEKMGMPFVKEKK